MSFAKILIGLNALVFVAYGLFFVFVPEMLSLRVTETSPATASGLIDMRATYGGVSVGLGLIFAMMARREALYDLGLRAVMAVNSCMAASRLLGILLDGEPNAHMWTYLALEVLVAALAFWALRSRSKSADRRVGRP